MGYSEIGAVLRSAREDRHMSLSEVARLLHIRARYLDAIERGDFTQLPGLPYAKGYMQAYAAFLELDKDELMRRFERVDGTLAKRNFYLPKAFHSEKKPHNAAVWGGLSAILVLYFLWHVSSVKEEKKISIVEHFQQKPSPEMQASILSALNPACFKGKDLLYPACYAKKQQEVSFNLVPLRGRPASVMELWDRQMAQLEEPASDKPAAKSPEKKSEGKAVAKSGNVAETKSEKKPGNKGTDTSDKTSKTLAETPAEKAALKPTAKSTNPVAEKPAESNSEKPSEEAKPERKHFKTNDNSHDGNTPIRSSEFPGN